MVLAVSMVVCFGCAERFSVTAPEPSEQIKPTAAADVWPSWAQDGSEIVYHRQFPDANGPAGIYAITPDGSRRRFLAPAGFLYPTRPRLSPSGRYLLLENPVTVTIVDLERGTTSNVLYTDNAVTYPDWSPDEQRILYARIYLDFGEPPDSGGVHILDLETGRDRALRGTAGTIFGDRTRWSPDGVLIAYTYGTPVGLYVADTSGTGVRCLFRLQRSGNVIRNVQWVTPTPGAAPAILALARQDTSEFVLLCDPVTAHCETLPIAARNWDAFSPDLKYLAYIKPTPVNRVPVLHVRSVSGDVPFVDLQLTEYRQP